MKKSIFLSLFVLIAISVISCKNEKKNEEAKPVAPSKGYTIDPSASSINWTAYKTTDKVPVKGQFTKFSIENSKKGSTQKEALNGLKFEIPVSSLFTKDTIRDGKLKKFFFGEMINTSVISGTLHMDDENSGKAELTMNGLTQSLPFTYAINDNLVNIEAVMNLDNWKAQAALEALNLACLDLHKGADGISKTWNEVKIEVITSFTVE